MTATSDHAAAEHTVSSAADSIGYIADRSPTGCAIATMVERNGDGWRLASHPTDPCRPGPATGEEVYANQEQAIAASRKRWRR